MKKILLFSLALCLAACTILSACKPQGTDPEDTASETESETSNEPNDREDPMNTVKICGKSLAGFRILADKTTTPAGKYLQTAIKAGTGAKMIVFIAQQDVNKTYAKLPYISIATLPINGESYNLADDEVKFFEKDGNFRIVVGSRKVSELTAAQYFVENILDGSVKDLEGYSEVAKLQKDTTVTPLIEAAEKKTETIVNAANHYSAADVTGNGKCYYVSYSTGNDSNDGLSPERPWKTVTKVSEAAIPSGSVVLFKRGDTWRLDDYSRGTGAACFLKLQSGVIYSSYGSGAKPTISGSPRDLAKTGTWTAVDGYENVWQYSEVYDGMSRYNQYYNDVGNMIFNNGEAYGYKMVKGVSCPAFANGLGATTFGGLGDLHLNYEFWFDPDACLIYLYYDGGNPSECFDSIEAAVRLNLMRAPSGKNIVVDNFILTYGGAHGVSTANVDGVHITNCEFRWLGGGIYDSSVSKVRYGNGIEFNLNSKNCYADNNLFYQIFDAGVTHQYDSRNQPNNTTNCINENINYLNNVFEYCVYSLEFFESHQNTTPELATRYMKDITVSGNYCLYAGYGFGFWAADDDRTNATHLQMWRNHLDCEIVDGTLKADNNVFVISKYKMARELTEKAEDVFIFTNNIFVQLEGNEGFQIGVRDVDADDGTSWDPDAFAQNKYLGNKNNTFLTIK